MVTTPCVKRQVQSSDDDRTIVMLVGQEDRRMEILLYEIGS